MPDGSSTPRLLRLPSGSPDSGSRLTANVVVTSPCPPARMLVSVKVKLPGCRPKSARAGAWPAIARAMTVKTATARARMSRRWMVGTFMSLLSIEVVIAPTPSRSARSTSRRRTAQRPIAHEDLDRQLALAHQHADGALGQRDLQLVGPGLGDHAMRRSQAGTACRQGADARSADGECHRVTPHRVLADHELGRRRDDRREAARSPAPVKVTVAADGIAGAASDGGRQFDRHSGLAGLAGNPSPIRAL